MRIPICGPPVSPARCPSAGGRVHLVGHSYGGAIALHVARDRPDLVASVAVYEPVVLRALFDYNARHRSAAEVAEIASSIRRDLNGGDPMRAAHRFLRYRSTACAVHERKAA